MYENLYKLKDDFLEFWNLDKLQNMTLDEYTDTKRENSFCYWLEHITRDLGSIAGGSSYKFGIYKMGATSSTESATNRTNDGIYAWHTKYGNTASEAFNTIKGIIINIANYAKENNLNSIQEIDLGDAYRWKIAFLYSDYKVVNIFKSDALKFIANSLFSSDNIPTKYGDLNDYILSHKAEEDYYDFTKKIWIHYNKYNSKEKEFKKWLEGYSIKGSNKSSSYLRAIKILINDFKIAVYTEENVNVLNDLYEDLKINQKDPNGKYAYHKKSYGEKGFYSAAINTYIQFLKNEPISIDSKANIIYENTTKENPKTAMSLNQILYGPPGTGKTYATKKVAVEIIDRVVPAERGELSKRYDELVEAKQIQFTTFHQSMSYEDFVEGIKPIIDDDNNVTYDVESGIFKELANSAKIIKSSATNINWKEKRFFKMSLGGKKEMNVHEWCLDNNLIALGWGGDKDLSVLKSKKDWRAFKEAFNDLNPILENPSPYQAAAAFKIIDMKIGDVVVVSLGNHIIDAIGIIEGDYFFDDSNDFGYPHQRKVKWVSTNMQTSPSKYLRKGISQQSIYEFYNKDIIYEAFEELSNSDNGVDKNYVLIIDEINRGNVSAIFGELITLLEEDKRLGNKEALEILLPYSKKPFSVPKNLHIIGTMNTADRSVEALDTALRRRFSFVEVMPDPELLADKASIEGVSLKDLLRTINERIEVLIDRDHTIGHAYFINIKNVDDLKETFKKNIIPLLQEYFFGDYGKIGLVLGEGFVKTVQPKGSVFAEFKNYDGAQDYHQERFELITIDDEFDIIKAIENLMPKLKEV